MTRRQARFAFLALTVAAGCTGAPDETDDPVDDNHPPVADAGADATVGKGDSVVLDGSASSDEDGDSLSYSWSQTSGPPVSLTDSMQVGPGFDAPMQAAELTFQLVVGDGEDVSAGDTVTITVENTAPVAVASAPATAYQGQTVTLTGDASSDDDGEALTYSWTQTAGASVTVRNATSANAEFDAPAVDGGLTFELSVSDGDDASTDAVTVTVVNQPPIADAGDDVAVVYKGFLVSLDGGGSYDPDGGAVSYAWTQTAGATVGLRNATTAAPDFDAPFAAGDLTFALVVNDGEAFSTADEVTVTVVNRLPVADAGADQLVAKGAEVGLDATASSDPDEESLVFDWTQTSGTTVTLSSATAAEPTFDAPGDAGDLVFQVWVGDGDDVATDLVTITVLNQAPVAHAGPDADAYKDAQVTLDGSASTDADGDSLTWTWTQSSGPAVTLSDPTAESPAFQAPATSGALVFALVVQDGDDPSLADEVTITVVNRAPSANAGPDAEAFRGLSVTLDGTASSDPDGDGFTFAWTQTSGTAVTLDDATAESPTFDAADVLEDLLFSLVVSDGEDVSPPDTVTITVVNQAPTADAGPDADADKGAVVTLDGTDSLDPEGDDLTFAWAQTGGTAVVLNDATAEAPTFTAPDVTGVLTFALTVHDGHDPSTADTVAIDVVNAPPVADAGKSAQAAKGAVVTLNGSGSSDPDPDPDDLTFAWTQTSGIAVTLDDATSASPEFEAPDASGDLVFSLVVDDGEDPSAADSVTISVVNAAPVADAGPDFSADKGGGVNVDGTGSYDPDPDPDDLTYAWTQTSGTPVVPLDPTAAYLQFDTPNVTGALVFELVVSDGEDTSAPDPVTVTVVNLAPVADAGDDAQANKGATVVLDGTGSSDPDPDPDNLTYAWTQVSGEPVTLDDETAASPELTAPDVTGALVFELVVSDGEDVSLSDSVTIDVVNRAPVADAGADEPSVNKGVVVMLDGTGSDDPDPDPDALTYAWTQTMGAQVSLDDATSATPSFTTPDATGLVEFELVVNDGEDDSAADSVSVTVINLDPVADAGTDQDAVNKGATVTLDGSGSSDPDPDPDALTYAWTQTSGTAVSLDDATSATPQFSAPTVTDTLVFSLVVDDGEATSAADEVSVTIVNQAPIADAGEDQDVPVLSTVTLLGEESFDPDDEAFGYDWSQTGGPPVVLSDATAMNPTFRAPPTTSAVAPLKFSLVVADGDDTSDPDEVVVTLTNLPPVADAGEDLTANGAELIWLDATGSYDPEDGPVTVRWRQTNGDPVALGDPVSPLLPVVLPRTATQGRASVVKFEVTVDDGESVDTDTVNVVYDPWQGQPVWADVSSPFGVVEPGMRSVNGDTAVVQDDSGQIHLYDITDPASPQWIASSVGAVDDVYGHVGDLVIAMYVNVFGEGVWEAWTPLGKADQLELVWTYLFPSTLWRGLAFSPDGSTAYLSRLDTSTGQYGLTALDLQDLPPSGVPNAPHPLASATSIGAMAASDTTLYVTYSDGSVDDLVAIDITPLQGSGTWGTSTFLDLCDEATVVLQQRGITDVRIVGGYLYAACGRSVRVFDLDTPQAPVEIASVAAAGARMHQHGDTLVVGGRETTVYEIDVSTPDDPQLLGVHHGPRLNETLPLALQTDGLSLTWRVDPDQMFAIDAGTGSPVVANVIPTTHDASALARAGMLYLGGPGLDVYDVTDPTTPTHLGTAPAVHPGGPRSLALESPHALLVGTASDVGRVDPWTLQYTVLATGFSWFDDLQVVDDHVLAGTGNGLVTVDLTQTGGSAVMVEPGAVRGLAVDGDTAWAKFSSEVQTWDVTDPGTPAQLDVLTGQTLGIGLVAYDRALMSTHGYGSLRVWPMEGGEPSDGAYLPYPGNGSPMMGVGTGSLYAVSSGAGVDLFDVSDPLTPILVAHHAASRLVDEISLDAGWAYLLGIEGDAVDVIDLRTAWFDTMYLTADGSQNLAYTVSWTEPADAGVTCAATGGAVKVFPPTGQSAVVLWKAPPTAPSDQAVELACAVGNHASFTILRDRLTIEGSFQL